MNYIKFNEYGQRSGMEITNIVKLSDNADRIYIFYDLDTSTEESAYRCFARIKRADGLKIADTILTLTIYAFDTEAEAEEYGTATYNEITLKWDVPCRELTMTEEMLGADGDLQITIVYQEVDELGSVIATKVNSMSVIPVYDSVAPEYDDASTLEILETFMLRDLSDITDGVQPTVADKILVRQGGATKLITVGQLNDLLETGITVFKKIAMDTASPASTLSIGETRWNAEVETLETRVSNAVYLQHGQELVFKCKNTSGVDIANGTPVYITGASGSSPNFYIAKASSSDYAQTSRCIGLTTEAIDDGAWGKVCVIGIVNGLNTNTFEVGDVVYLGAGGIITNVRPTTNVLALGVVIQKSLTDGRIALRPIFFPRPEDLSTVHYSGLANGDILVKDATGWTNYALANKANVADLTAGTITVKKAEQDQYGSIIDETYLKISGVSAMEGNLNLGTNKIINLVDGVANQDGATMKNIDTKITAHDGSETAHLYIRELIQDVKTEIARVEGRGKSYGELALKQSELLALEESARNTAIYNDILARHTSYELANAQLVYTLEDASENTHEWEYNSTLTTWVDNGAYITEKASNTNHGLVKGDSTYLSIVSGLVEVLKSNYADKIGTSGGSYTYTQLLSAFNDRYTKAEVDALLDALKTAFGWEETDLGDYSTAIDLSSYDLVLLQLIATDIGGNNYVNTQMIKPADYATDDTVSLIARESLDDVVIGAGVIVKGATTWSYQQITSTPILKMRGYKIKPIQAENVVYDNSTSGLTADDVNGAIDEIKEDLDLKEIASNKVTAFQETPDDSHYASEKLVKDSLDAKVDKVAGKGLSTNDFTNEKSAQIETNKTDIATNLANQALTDSRQDLRLATVEENLRKSMAGEVTGTADGTAIVSLGKDVANAPLQVKVDGGLIDSDNQLSLVSGTQDGLTITVTGNQITINGTASADTSIALASGLTIGNKAYVNYDFISGTGALTLNDGTALHSTYNADYSGVVTLATTSLTLEIASGQAFSSLIIKININKITALISVKQYSPLYNKTFDLMSDAEIKAQMDLWVKNGTLPNDNVLAVGMNKRVRSVGKNLFSPNDYVTFINDKAVSSAGYVYQIDSDTIINAKGNSAVNLIAFDFIDFIPLTQYTLKMAIREVATDQELRFRFYYTDGTYTQLTGSLLTTSFADFSATSTEGKTIDYIALLYSFNSQYEIKNPQLEQGTEATTYEPYVSSDLFLQANKMGYKLPNGVADTIEYRNGKYYYVKRVSDEVVFDGDESIDFIVSTNDGLLAIFKVITATYYPNEGVGVSDTTTAISNFFNQGLVTASLTVEKFDMESPSSYFAVLKTRMAGWSDAWSAAEKIAAFKTWLQTNNLKVRYLLATPTETEILSSGNLNGYQNGTVYVDDVMQDADIYATNATITNTDYPIKTLEKIVKINSDGSQTDLAVSGATVASGGLSFTHSSLTSGDKVWFSYVYDVANLFKSTSIITFYDNKFVIADTANGKIYKWAVTSTNGVASIALTEV